MNCITIEIEADRFASVLNGAVINVSRHKDYSLFHFKARDVRALKTQIDKFIFIDILGTVKEIIEADQLKQRGVNYATAKRSDGGLTDEEINTVAQAFELVEAFVAKATPTSAKKVPHGDGEADDQKQDNVQLSQETGTRTVGEASTDGDAAYDVPEATGETAATEGVVDTDVGGGSASSQAPIVSGKKKRRH